PPSSASSACTGRARSVPISRSRRQTARCVRWSRTSSHRHPAPQDKAGDRRPVRRLEAERVTVLEHLCDLIAAEPADILELGLVTRDLAAERLGEEADHQGGGDRPGLAGKIAYATDADAGLLEDLAPHRVLERFARLHEAGKARIHARREAGLTPEQAALTVDREHDGHRVGARKVRRATLRAVAAPAGIGHLREGSAQSAEAVRPVPVDKAAGLSGCPELVLGKGFAHEQAANV